MAPKGKKQRAVIDLTRTTPLTSFAAISTPSTKFDPRVLLNPRAGLAREHSSPEKTANDDHIGNAIERLHRVQARSVPQKRRRDEDTGSRSPDKQDRGKGGIVGKDLSEAATEVRKMNRASDHHSDELNMTVTQTTEVSNENDYLEGGDDSLEITGVSGEKACFGLLKSSINAHTIPDVICPIPTQWPPIAIILERGPKMTKLINVIHKASGIRLGSLEGGNASTCLARALDLHLVRVEGRIPARPKLHKDGESTANNVSVILPVEITCYGNSSDLDRVNIVFSQGNCFLSTPVQYDRQHVLLLPHNRRRIGSTRIFAAQMGTSIVRTAEEIKSEIQGLFNKIQNVDTLALTEPSVNVKTRLLKHQKQALTFLLQRENYAGIKEPQDHDVWQAVTQNGITVYKNAITPQILKKKPIEIRGGILADEMGLGKTLSMLSLIAYTLTDAKKWSNSGVGALGDNGIPRTKTKATLIVCPLSVLNNWTEQISTHIGINVRVLLHHEKTRTYNPLDFQNYDVIITTYAIMATEYKHLLNKHKATGDTKAEKRQKKKAKDEVILPRMEFFRVVLDEAHIIKDMTTQQSIAASSLEARSRWALTATPVQNGLNDLASLFHFMRLEPFDNRALWSQYISQPMKNGDQVAVSRLQTLLKMRTLRRTKDFTMQTTKFDTEINSMHVNDLESTGTSSPVNNESHITSLPPRTEEIRLLKLSDEERRVYNNHLSLYQSKAGLGKPGGQNINVLQSINRLRQICISIAILAGSNHALSLESMHDKLAQGETHQLQAYELFEIIDGQVCCVCQADISTGEDDPPCYFARECSHFYCNKHASAFFDARGNSIIQSCLANDCENDYAELSMVESTQQQKHEAANGERNTTFSAHHSADSYSTKIQALIADLVLLKDTADPEDPVKSVVFSQFTSFLDEIGHALNDMGIAYTRLDGSMSRDDRAIAISRFEREPRISVILVSTRAGGVGLNLTMAWKVFVMEPSWNPSIESQAMDRVHRIGQKHPVHYVRYVIEDSIEQTMISLQKQKTELADLSLAKNLSKEGELTKKLLSLKSLFK